MFKIIKNGQYRKFCAYGFLKNLRFFDAFLLLYFIDKGLTFTEFGVLYAAREVLTNVFEFPSGIAADLYGRKLSLLFSFVLYIVSFFIFYVSSEFYLLLLAICVFGIAEAFRSGTHKGMIMDYLRMNGMIDLKVTYYGHTRSWSQMGSAVSALLAGVMVLIDGNYDRIFLYSTIPYFINFINVYSYPDQLNFSSQTAKPKDRKQSIFKDIKTSSKDFHVLWITYSSVIHAAFLKSIKDYIQPIIVSLAIATPILLNVEKEGRSGLFVGVIYFIIYMLTSFASKYSGRLLELKISNISSLSLIVGLLAGIVSGWFFQTELWLASIVFFVVVYVIENARKPILTGEITDAVPPEILTSVLSAQSFIQTILTMAISLGLGISADYFGIGNALMIVSATVLVLTFGLMLLMRKK